MPTLRSMLDGTTISAAAPMAKKPSPVAQHVANHVQDPIGSTKEGFGKLSEAKLNYDMAREEMQRNLAPVQGVINHVSQLHNLDPNQDSNMIPGMNPDEEQGYDENGNPINMQQTAGKMNSNRPSLVGQQPGVSPGPQQSVRPPKLGQASPGAPMAKVPNPGNAQFNPKAAPPKGAKSMPGAKGPGDKKVANKTNQAQNNSSRQIKVHVSAASVHPVLHAAMSGSENRIETQFGLATLRSNGVRHSEKSDIKAAYQPTRGPIEPRGNIGVVTDRTAITRPSGTGAVPSRTGRSVLSKKMKAGPAELQDKATDSELALNPVIRGGHKKGCMCAECKDKMNAGHGTSHGAKKGWSTRGKGHLSKVEKAAHYQTMDAGGPGSGRHPGFGKGFADDKDYQRARNNSLKDLAHDAKQGVRMASKASEPRLTAFLEKLHQHLSGGNDPKDSHISKIENHGGRMENKGSKHSDFLDYGDTSRLSDKGYTHHERMTERYGELAEHLADMSDRMREHNESYRSE